MKKLREEIEDTFETSVRKLGIIEIKHLEVQSLIEKFERIGRIVELCHEEM